MTKEAAVNLSYLYAAELLKEAAEEDGVDLDAEAQKMSDEEMAELLDGTVADLAEAGELEPIFEEVDDEALDANASEPEGEEYESAEVDEELEAEAGLFIAKTAALLDKAAGFAEDNPGAFKRHGPPKSKKGKAFLEQTKKNMGWKKGMERSRPRGVMPTGHAAGSKWEALKMALKRNKKAAAIGGGLLAAGGLGAGAYALSKRKKG